MGPTSTRKEREIQEREELLLDVARAMLLERGYLGLTMDRVADATEYSKGTIYQHFSSKEDLIAALIARTAQMRAHLFERAAAFRGNTRERIGAIGAAAELFLRLYPDHYQAEKAIKATSVREKASPERQRQIEACEFRCVATAIGVARDAVAQGDLVLPPGMTVEDVTMGLWTMYTGTFEILDWGVALDTLGFGDPLDTMRRNAQLFLDAAGWTPLMHEHDYPAARERALREVFPEEARKVGLV